jgi:hypothetical protein
METNRTVNGVSLISGLARRRKHGSVNVLKTMEDDGPPAY